jgi:hypothetical protein
MISTPNEHAGQTGQKDSPYWGAVLSVRLQDTRDKADRARCVRPVRSVRPAYLDAISPTEALGWLNKGLVKGRQLWRTQAPRRHP